MWNMTRQEPPNTTNDRNYPPIKALQKQEHAGWCRNHLSQQAEHRQTNSTEAAQKKAEGILYRVSLKGNLVRGLGGAY